MKKIFYGLLIILLLGLSSENLKAQNDWVDYAAISFASGTGSPTSPFVISTPQQLAYLAKLVRDTPGYSTGKYFKLGNNIDLGEFYWNLPIGRPTGYEFRGSFDGNGYAINYLNNSIQSNYFGLFGYTVGASIKYLTVNVDFSIIKSNDYVGMLIGYAKQTTVTNCSVKMNRLYGLNYVGGFIGYADQCTLTDCKCSGIVKGNNMAGGFIGYGNGITNITRCSSEGSVLGLEFTGGFIGKNDNAQAITNCYSSVSTEGERNVGGFIGYHSGTKTISGCYASGAVSASLGIVGGFIGLLDKSLSVINCHAAGSVSGINTVGGFIGFAGGTETISISGCFSTGAVTEIPTPNYSGGFSGGFIGGANGTIITGCYSSGSIKGAYFMGGFIGQFDGSSATDCYAVGSVYGKDDIGGFVGISGSSTIIRCFAAGAVIGDNPRGGFVGTASSGTSFANCYFDKQSTGFIFGSGAGDVSGITGFATSTLATNALSGFPTSSWVFTPGYYPQLKTFAQSADAAIKSRSALSAVPLILANDTELSGDVQTVFRLTDKMPAGDAITWTADLSEKVTVFNNSVYAEASDTWRTLTLRADNNERTIKFRSTKGILTADILNVKIAGTTYDNIDPKFTYRIECGSSDGAAFAEIFIGPYATCSPGSPITLYANIPQEITVTTVNGKSKKYTFVAEKLLPTDLIFEQRWKDVLAVNNNFATNGNYIFTAYEWYKDGNKLPSTKGYIQEPGGLSKTAKYTAVLTTQQGDKIGTCPATITTLAVKMAAWPNPAQRGQTVRVDTGIAADALGGAVVQLFGPSGNIVAKQNLHDPVAEIAMPDTPGQYLLQVTTADGAKQTFKIAVE